MIKVLAGKGIITTQECPAHTTRHAVVIGSGIQMNKFTAGNGHTQSLCIKVKHLPNVTEYS